MRLLPDPPLLVITDRHQAAPRSLEWVVAAVLEGGARWISVREKDLDPADRLDLLRRLQPLAEAAEALLMVHDDLQAARQMGLGGLHLPADGDAAAARALLPNALIGQSWHGAEPFPALSTPCVDYLTLSPIFLTASKPGYGPALGTAGLAEASTRTAMPIVALGGISQTNIAACMRAGAAGVAVMGSVMRASDPAGVCADLLSCFLK